MIDVSDLPRAIMDILGTESTYHFFVVAGYNNAERILLCKYYGKGYYVIKYDELVRRWSRTGFFYVEVRPSAAVDYFNKGAELEYLGRYQEARENYMKAIEKDSEHFLSYVGLGNVSLAVGDFESALKAYQRALSLDRTEPKILNNLANLYVERGENLEEAEKLAEEAVQRYKKILDDLNTRIVSGQEEGSVKKLHQEKEFEYCLALGTLGEARLRLGKYTLAISSWEAAISIIPLTKFDLRAKRLYEIGLAYKNLKETQKAGHYFRQAIDLVKDSELKSKIQKEILDSPVK
jgi:tetratricopeptide (TPR) repeat protein